MPQYIINLVQFNLTKQDLLIINSIKKHNLGHRVIKVKGVKINLPS